MPPLKRFLFLFFAFSIENDLNLSSDGCTVQPKIRMRQHLFLVAIALMCGCTPSGVQPCVVSREAIPETWQPVGSIHHRVSQNEWTAGESADAARAVREGLDELTAFFSTHPAAVESLGSDAVESVLDTAYSASNMPDLQDRARTEARYLLAQLVAPMLKRNPGSVRCNEFQYLLSLTIYTHQLRLDGEALMAALTNASFHNCGSLDRAH